MTAQLWLCGRRRGTRPGAAVIAPFHHPARDPVSGRGPLQGLAAGLGALPNRVELAYATATDVPFLEPGWITRLASLIGDQDLAIPRCQGYHHPLAALYRRARVIPAIQALLAANRLRPVFLMEDLPTRVVTEEELLPVDPRLGTLRNLNTPEEYHAALVEAGLASAANPATAENTPPPRIRVELFGVPRLRAGLAELIVEGFSLGDALTAVATACPPLEGTVLRGGRPLPAYAVNLNGDRFVTDPSTRLSEGDTLIVLDLDMGG